MLRMVLGRRWKRWLRLVLLLLFVFVIWNLFEKSWLSDVVVDDLKSARIFDHWGEDDSSFNWLPNLLSQRTQEIPVVVVEEHYEVLKYWFQAADLGVIPMSKNILIHIDGHVDGALPFDTDSIPLFHYPRSRQEIQNMMQRNDMFIAIAALAGFINHVIWVWPDWDASNHEKAEQFHLIFDVEIGYAQIKIQEERSRHKLDVCICWKVREDKKTGNINEQEVPWECHRRNFTEIEAEDGPKIDRSHCEIQSRGVYETMSETAAASELRKFKASGENVGIILDIDEDFFGCWSDVKILQEAGILRKDIDLISNLVADLFFGLTAHEEQLADEFYSSLIHLVTTLKSQSCEVKGWQEKSDKKNCFSNIEITNYLIENNNNVLAFLKQNNGDSVLRLKDSKHLGLYLQSFFLFFQNFSLKQLKVLADLGICLTHSPASRYFHEDGQFHICHGDNTPNNTMVTFHLPTEPEIATRTASFQRILSSLFQKPDLVTVCRSIRDGYTPKQFFRTIEGNILQGLASTYRAVHYENIHFDINLLGGKFGWPHRSQRLNHKLLQHLSLQEVSHL